MSFKKNKYLVLKNAISPEIANFVFNYFLIKRQAFNNPMKFVQEIKIMIKI